jgi:hypothetical protein
VAELGVDLQRRWQLLIRQSAAGAAYRDKTADGELGFLSLKDRRGYLIPLTPHRAAQAALTLYPAQTLKARLLKKALAWSLRLGIAQNFLPRATLIDPQETRVDGGYPLFAHLREILRDPTLMFAVSFGTPGPQRKPVLVALTPDGVPAAFIKVGWSDLTRRLVETECHALEFLAAQPFQWGRLPQVLYFGAWKYCRLLVVEPIMLTSTPRSVQLSDLHLRFLTELSQVRIVKRPWVKSLFARRLLTRLRQVEPYVPLYQMRILEEAAEQVQCGLQGGALPWVWRMGDFAPWNIGVDRVGQKIHIVDFEYAEADSLLGWDLFHFFRSASRCAATGMSFLREYLPGISPYFSRLGIDTDQIRFLYLAYLLDLYVMRKHLCWPADPASWEAPWFRQQARSIAAAMLQFKKSTTSGDELRRFISGSRSSAPSPNRNQ